MNRKIINHVLNLIKNYFNLPKYKNVVVALDLDLDELPWTPARLRKFKDELNNTFDLEIDYSGTIEQITKDIDCKYSKRFWDSIWQPRTEEYQFSGWSIVDRINKQDPKSVLDVGCGFNQFKSRINNLVGIDPYNNCADYMVDVLDYAVPNESYDHIIAFGSINFGDFYDIEIRMSKIFDLLKKDGTLYMRVNPGISHKNGPWIDIFEWNFEHAHHIARMFNVELVTFKQDNNRYYIEYKK